MFRGKMHSKGELVPAIAGRPRSVSAYILQRSEMVGAVLPEDVTDRGWTLTSGMDGREKLTSLLYNIQADTLLGRPAIAGTSSPLLCIFPRNIEQAGAFFGILLSFTDIM